MRPIDADALRESFLARARRAEDDSMPMTAAEMMLVVRDIDRAPTVEKPEPVEPEHFRSTIRSFGSDGFRDECAVDSYKCGNCHKAIKDTHSFCPWCGRAVKWRV